MTKWTASRIKALKGKKKIACLTAYDYSTARILDEAGIELLLVGDSLAMTMLGYKTTLPVTMEEMIHHTSAVVRGVENSLVVADMPFMSFQISEEKALENACRFIKESGAGAVKIEGGKVVCSVVEKLVQSGVPVLGHIGLTPQSINEMGGYKVQGKHQEQQEKLIEDAKALEKSGVFAIVIECVPSELGKEITLQVKVPIIGIGAGPYCDGQILVSHDILGLFSGHVPKFVKQYTDLKTPMIKAFKDYKSDVENGEFPAANQSY